MWSFHNFNCIFICSDIGQRWVVSFCPTIFSHSAIPSNDYIQLKYVHGKRALALERALHSSLLFNRSFIIIIFVSALWYVSIPCALLRASSVEWLRWMVNFRLFKCEFSFNSLFSSIRTNYKWESMLYNSIRNVGEHLQRVRRTLNMNPNWWFYKWY